jgi:hypothetical protein
MIRWILGGLLAFGMAASAFAQTAAYVRGADAPWGETTNEAAMDQVFGSGNWSDLRMAGGVGPVAPGSGFSFVFLEGGDNSALELATYLDTHRAAIEAFVQNGGRLLLNSAPNEGGDIDFGFGGVTLTYPGFSDSVVAADPAHPIFVGPFTPVVTAYTGSHFGHAIVGPGISPIIIGAPGDGAEGETVLGELPFGSGAVLFGGMTTDNFHDPETEAANLRANIISYAALGATANPTPDPTPIPVMGGLGMLLLGAGLGLLGLLGFRRRA